MTRHELRCDGRTLGRACNTVLGELVNGRLEVTRIGLIARGGEVSISCRKCGKTRVVDLDRQPVLDRAAV